MRSVAVLSVVGGCRFVVGLSKVNEEEKRRVVRQARDRLVYRSVSETTGI